ncbi:MAG: hypothetical protein JNM56_30355 [Planctomycetia bacterium]|nr:hypothetical protein [Planctomycetia bacterium]
MRSSHVARVLLCLTLAALAGPALGQADKGWKDLSPKGGGFSVKMPGEPKENSQQLDAGGGKLEIRTYTLEVNQNLVYVVAYNQMPTDANKIGDADKKKILDGAREGMLNNIKGKLLKEANITLDKNAGRDWQFDALQGKMYGRSRAFLVGDRMYQVMVMGEDKGVMTNKDTETYLASFKLAK